MNVVLRQALFGLSQQSALKTFATRSPMARRLATRFVAGETLAQALQVVRHLNAQGMTSTLDHLGENVATQAEAGRAAETYRHILREMAAAAVDANISVKLTQMGLDLSPDLAYEHAASVVRQAAELGNFVRIDMEGSSYTQATFDIFDRLFAEYRNVGVVIQAYLYRSADDVARMNAAHARVRLVKGAYLEPTTVAYQNKEDVDWNFVRLMEHLLERGTYPAIATHDEAMIAATRTFAAAHNVGQDEFEFQMLYGIRRDLQTRIVADGYRMRIYVPYGTEWYPYLMRRLAERPANLMFVLGNIAREARRG